MKKRESYDRIQVGKRLQTQRKQLGWSRGFTAEKIGLVEKYYADIERGTCGMSVETLLALAKLYECSTDFILFGHDNTGIAKKDPLLRKMERLPEEQQETCRKLILLYMEGIGLERRKER